MRAFLISICAGVIALTWTGVLAEQAAQRTGATVTIAVNGYDRDRYYDDRDRDDRYRDNRYSDNRDRYYGGGWTFVGRQRMGLDYSRVRMDVDRDAGRVDQIRLTAGRHSMDIRRITLIMRDGDRVNLRFDGRIPYGRSVILDLPGRGQQLDRVEIVAKKAGGSHPAALRIDVR